MGVSWKTMAALTVIVAAILSYGTYYAMGMPTEERVTTTLCTYEQDIGCDYIAYLKPNTLYGEEIGKGETIYMNLVNHIIVKFNYRFKCSLAGNISTEYKVYSLLENPGELGWSKPVDELVSVEKSEAENTTSATVDIQFSYNITKISELIRRVEEETGVSSPAYQMTTKVTVNTIDETDVGKISKPIEESIVLKLNYMGRGGLIELVLPEKSLRDSIVEDHTREIASALQLRTAMFAALTTWTAAASSFTAWKYSLEARGKAGRGEPETPKRLNVIESVDMPDLKAQTLCSIEGLKKVADEYGSIIFHTRTASNEDIYFTTVDDIIYQYVTRKLST